MKDRLRRRNQSARSSALPCVTVADCERPVPGQRGSPDGWDFDEVYRSRWSGLVRLAYVTTESLPLAEEAAQDAFLQLYRLRHTVRQPDAWLRQAVVSKVTSWVRRRRLERAHARAEKPGAVPPMAAVEFVALLRRCHRANGPRCSCAITRTCPSRTSHG